MLWKWSFGVLMVLAGGALSFASGLTDQDAQAAVRYWSEGDRYRIAPAVQFQGQPYQPRMTAAGSAWLHRFEQARGRTKTPARVVALAGRADLDQWVKTRYEAEWELMAQEAELRNSGVPSFAAKPTLANPPADLIAVVGELPKLVDLRTPLDYEIRFHDATYRYTDNVAVPHRYAYYRFEEGVRTGGTAVRRLDPAALRATLNAAGISDSDWRVFSSVSSLEGGFDSVNTYDTGFVSVGFIQFAAHAHGRGAISRMLARFAADSPDAYREDFVRFGVGVQTIRDERDREVSELMATDLRTGAVLTGEAAVRQIIQDKRLLAVFQRAGERSELYRIAQLRTAYTDYFPLHDTVQVRQGEEVQAWRVADIIRSEAGRATLMDRKVHTGNFGGIEAMIQQLVATVGADDPSDLWIFERALIDAIRHRRNYLAEASLSQPLGEQRAWSPRPATDVSRAGNTRGGRGGNRGNR